MPRVTPEATICRTISVVNARTVKEGFSVAGWPELEAIPVAARSADEDIPRPGIEDCSSPDEARSADEDILRPGIEDFSSPDEEGLFSDADGLFFPFEGGLLRPEGGAIPTVEEGEYVNSVEESSQWKQDEHSKRLAIEALLRGRRNSDVVVGEGCCCCVMKGSVFVGQGRFKEVWCPGLVKNTGREGEGAG